jgi:Acetyltransferase (GNAT) domain
VLTVHRPPLDDVDWNALDAFGDRGFTQRRHWLEFVASFTGGELVVAELHRAGELVGYFNGILFRRCGIPILGSPFRGWTTPYMGCNLAPGTSRIEALASVERFAFRELGCLHLEVTDRHFTPEDAGARGYAHRPVRTLITDLTECEDRLLANMTSACRRAIRKAEKSGVIVEPATPDGFAEEYHAQLQDVFAKQDLRPTYSSARVHKLIEHVHPSGDLLLARVRDADGRSIATGIFPGFGSFSFFWGNGSLRAHQILRPNEALHWFAMRYWKQRGMHWHDWGGANAYKAKYGVVPFATVALRKSRYAALQYARDLAERLYYFPRDLRRRRYDEKIAGARGGCGEETPPAGLMAVTRQ